MALAPRRSGGRPARIGDPAKAEYDSKRDAIDADLGRASAGADPDGTRALPDDFGRLGRKIVAVRPTPTFVLNPEVYSTNDKPV
jgi:hypothetical protein